MYEDIDKVCDLVVCGADFVCSLNGVTPESALSLLCLVCMKNWMVSSIKSICMRCLCGMNESILNPLRIPMFTSYGNQSVDFQSKSIDWFLYDGNIVR